MSVQKTILVRHHYSDVLMKLCGDTRLNELKVSDVVGASGMSRQTFYNHFDGLDDLVTYTASRALTETEHPLFDPRNILESYQFAYRHRSFFSQLPSQTGYGTARDKLCRWLRRLAYERFAPEDMPATERLRRMTQMDLFLMGSTEVIFTWMGSGCILPIEVVAPAVIEMMPACMIVPPQRLAAMPIDPLSYPK